MILTKTANTRLSAKNGGQFYKIPKVQIWKKRTEQPAWAKFRHQFLDRDKPYTGTDVIASDVDGDGRKDVICGAWGYQSDSWQRFVIPNIYQVHLAYDIDKDGKSEWICELNGNAHSQTRVYCLTLNGKFPASSPWPEYYHCAYPADYQKMQDWLTLKAAYSNSLWFPIPEVVLASFALLAAAASSRERTSGHSSSYMVLPGLLRRGWEVRQDGWRK